jgi:unsaturated rhamnogalacturonyl hydrolase
MSWEQGLAAQAFFECGETQTAILMVDEAIHRSDGKGLIGVTDRVWDSIDCGSNGLPAHYAYLHTKNRKYQKAADDMADWFEFSAPRSDTGQLYHNPGRHVNMIDGIYHIVPVLIVTGRADFAVNQIQLYHERHYDPASKLYRQLWDDDARSFSRRDLWTTGNGWMACALALACKLIPDPSSPHHRKLAEMLNCLIDAMLPYLREDFLYHDVINDPTTFAEITAPMMLAYAIYTGISANAVPLEKKSLADDILLHAEKHVDDDGIVNDACSSPTFDRLGRSAEAQAFYMLCCAAEQAVS